MVGRERRRGTATASTDGAAGNVTGTCTSGRDGCMVGWEPGCGAAIVLMGGATGIGPGTCLSDEGELTVGWETVCGDVAVARSLHADQPPPFDAVARGAVPE
jgi:hypothetical protein